MAAEEATTSVEHTDAQRVDGWLNILTGLGIAARDKRTGTRIATLGPAVEEELEALFHGDDMIARVCELPPHEMVRKGITITVEDDVDAAVAMSQRLETLGAMKAILEALVWARVFGGALIVVGADDGGDPAEPLDEEKLAKLDWLHVVSRFDVRITSHDGDIESPTFGQPLTYEFNQVQHGTGTAVGAGTGQPRTIHASRVLRFDGVLTTRRRKIENSGWCDSVITRLQTIAADFGIAWTGVAHLLQDFSQAVFKMKGLAKLLATDQDGLVLQRMQLMDIARSVARAVILDSDGEEFERKATPVTGLGDLLDKFALRYAAAARMPVSLLMGQAPAGLNATGDSDIRWFYDRIAAAQETELRPQLERLLTLLWLADNGPTNGDEPDVWAFVFNPLWQLDDEQQAKRRKDVADADATYIEKQVLSPDEVRASRFGGDGYSADTTLDESLRGDDELLDEGGNDA